MFSDVLEMSITVIEMFSDDEYCTGDATLVPKVCSKKTLLCPLINNNN